MSSKLYGYRQRQGKGTIREEEALVIRAILRSPQGERMMSLRYVLEHLGIQMSPLQQKELVNRILKHREWYAVGKISIDSPPQPELMIV